MQDISANHLPINYAVNLTLLHKGEVSKIKKEKRTKNNHLIEIPNTKNSENYREEILKCSRTEISRLKGTGL